MRKRSAFWRLTWRAIARQPRTRTTLLAVALGAAVMASLGNLYLDMGRKLAAELRAYGSNLSLQPANAGQALDAARLEKALALLPREQLVGAAPYLYDVAVLEKVGPTLAGRQTRAVVVGVDFANLAGVKPYLRPAGGWSQDQASVVVGAELAGALRLDVGDKVRVESLNPQQKGKALTLSIAGLVNTGAEEDWQLFLPLKEAREIFSRAGEVDGVWLSVLAGEEGLSATGRALESAYPGTKARVVARVARTEEKVLASLSTLVYLVALVIWLSTMLCLLATMTTAVSERRVEMGLKKALGCSSRDLGREFLAEAFLLGLLGGLLGLVPGWLLAQLLGRLVFGQVVGLWFPIIPATVGVAVIVASLSALLPVRQVQEVRPALVLRGE